VFLGLILYNRNDPLIITYLLIVNIEAMKITKKHLLALIFLSVFAMTSFSLTPSFSPAQADETLFNSQTGMTELGQVYGNQKTDLRGLIGKIINIVLGFLTVIFLALTIFAGFQYMTSAGNEEQTKKALSLLKSAIIGLLIILMSWAITRFVIIISSKAVNNSVDYTTYREKSF